LAGKIADGEKAMGSLFLKLYLKLQDLLSGDEGQDLIEYAMLITLIPLALLIACQGIAASIVGIFTNISTSLT
jgi:pilus assembly protein Flp/PilA